MAYASNLRDVKTGQNNLWTGPTQPCVPKNFAQITEKADITTTGLKTENTV